MGNFNLFFEEILIVDIMKILGGFLGLVYESEEDSDEEFVSIFVVKWLRN